MTDKSLQYANWFKDRLKKEDSTVQTVGEKVASLLMEMKFIMSSDDEKEKQLNAIAGNLTADQKAALEKIDEESTVSTLRIGKQQHFRPRKRNSDSTKNEDTTTGNKCLFCFPMYSLKSVGGSAIYLQT